MRKVNIRDLGRVDFKKAWELQTKIVERMVLEKRKTYKDPNFEYSPRHQLLFCEHNPVYTLGKSGKKDNLLLNQGDLANSGFDFFKINRGGDITYHGPGQIVVYPIFDLDFFYNDLHRYIRDLEEVIIQFLKIFGIKGIRLKGFTGVWIAGENNTFRKICAIGVHMSRWITMHGLALNINTQLDHFNNIVPCGIAVENKTVTSLESELGEKTPLIEVKALLKGIFAKVFDFQVVNE